MCKDSIRSACGVILACAAIWAVAGKSFAATEGPFLSAGVGATLVQDFNVTLDGFIPMQLKTDPGIRFNVGVGYTLYASPAFESAVGFETGVIHNSVKSLSFPDIGESSSDGDFYQVPFLADIIYRFHIGPNLVPSIAVGGGGVYQRLTVDSLNGAYLGYRASETVAAVQGTAALTYRFDDHNELGVAYQYLVTFPSTDNYAATHSLVLQYVFRF